VGCRAGFFGDACDRACPPLDHCTTPTCDKAGKSTTCRGDCAAGFKGPSAQRAGMAPSWTDPGVPCQATPAPKRARPNTAALAAKSACSPLIVTPGPAIRRAPRWVAASPVILSDSPA
jgi:hypothetical protein